MTRQLWVAFHYGSPFFSYSSLLESRPWDRLRADKGMSGEDLKRDGWTVRLIEWREVVG